MAKHLNISLGVTADTSKAKAQLQDLQNQLTKIINSPTSNKFTLTKDLKEASAAATELQAHLQRATNMETGALDFTKLNQSLASGKKSLADYGHALLQIGPDGEKAFLQLTKSVAQSEIPFRRVNKQLNEMWTTLKNSARWQISSSILHGFMGAVSSAYGYAQDLNESLTNIRIVTGQNTDQMAKFAKEANAAAKALSTTTTRYTNASLIYYQQGLSDEEVKKRTDITVKMANAAGASAETVSDQLTAVWNNFYDGTKSLEHYADVMTALGAATASSTDEIAGGLEKFAAIADTIGLSYEYAASALATITSNTRQSEEVVGTALKTIFARIQGLNLGETLEDGTSLNKYSEALAKVGIDIFEVNGEIKKMDNILNELGAKWQQLGKDQQIALAQTVAGVRQYNQLVSFMDNWDNGDNDSFQANLNTANTSEGALQKQADIYAEGWEAASNRVRASWEGIYETIVDDDVFIPMLNGLAEMIQFVDRLIDGVGGLGGVMSGLGALGTAVFSKQIAGSLSNAAYGIKMMMPGAYEAQQELRQNTINDLAETYSNHDFVDSTQREAVSQTYKDILDTQVKIGEKSANLNELEQFKLNILKEQQQTLADQYIEAQQQYAEANIEQGDITAQLNLFKDKDGNLIDSSNFKNTINATATIKQALTEVKTTGELTENAVKKIKDAVATIDDESDDVQNLIEIINNLTNTADVAKQEIAGIKAAVNNVESESSNRFSKQVKGKENKQKAKQVANNYVTTTNKKTQLKGTIDQTKQNSDVVTGNIHKLLDEGHENTIKWSEGIVAAATSVMALTSALQTYKGILEVANDDTLTFGEKATAIASSLASTALNLAFTIGSLGKTFGGTAGIIKGFNAATAFLNPSLAATGAASGAAATGVAGLASAFGSLMIAAAPWLAIAALVVGSIIAIDEAFVSEKEAAEEAAKSAKHLAEEYDRINESYQTLKDNLSNYQEAKNGIAELTKGTQEYKEAVLAANEQALDLLENNKDLAYTIEDDGLINIDDEALEKLQQEKLNSLTNAQNMKILAQQKSSETNIDLERSKLNSNAKNEDVLSAIQNKFNSGTSDMFANDEIFRGRLIGLFGSEMNLDQINAITKEREAIEELVKELNKNTASQETNNKLIVQNTFGEDLSDSGLSSQGQDLASTILSKKVDEVSNNLAEEYKKGEIETDKLLAISKEYGKTYGLDFDSVYWEDGKPSEVKYTYEDQFGEIQEKFVDFDMVAQFGALQEALELSADELSNVITIVEDGTKDLNEAQTEALTSFANGEIGDLSKLTESEITELQNGLQDQFKELADAIGATDIENAFDTAVKNVKEARSNFFDSLAVTDEVTGLTSNTVQEVFKQFNDNSNISNEGAKAIGNVLKNAFIEGGSEGLTVAQTLFAEAGDKAGEVANIVSSIDWQTATVETLNDRLIDAGIQIPKASGALAEFVEWINKVRGAASAASNSEFYNATQEILEQMKSGGTISREQLDYLRNSDNADIKALADNFHYNADGTFGFKGTNADVYKAEEMLKQEYHNRFGGSAKEFAQEAQNIQALGQVGIEQLTNSFATDDGITEQRFLAIKELMWDVLDEEAKQLYMDAKEAFDKGGTGALSTEQHDFLTGTIGSNATLYNEGSINAAYEDKIFETQMNMQADFSLAESEEEVKEYLETYKEVPGAIEAAEKKFQELNNSLLADELGIEKEKIDQVAKSYMDMGMSAETAYRQAENHLRLNDGLEKLKDNWKEYSTVLKDTRPGAESTAEYIQTFEELQNILSNITGISNKEIFTKDWVKKNIKAIEQVSKGSEKALDDIQDQFAELRAQEAVLTVIGETDFDNIDPALQALSSELAAFEINNDIKVGATLDAGPMIDGLNKVLAHTNWTKEQIKACLLEMGYDAEVHMVETEYTWDVPIFEAVNDDGSGISSNSPIDAPNAMSNGITGTRQITGKIQVPAIRTITKTGQSFGGNVNVSNSSAGGGGGGSSDEPTQMEYTKEIDFYERYKEWDDALDDIDDVLSDVQKKEDALYGQNKIAAMKNRNKLLLKEVEALQQKKKEAEAYFEIDKQNLQNAAGALGYEITFGSRDQILNYTSTMQGLFDELHAMEVHFNSLGSGKAQQQYKKDVLDPFNQKVDDLKQYIDQYDETRELIEDLENDIDDSLYEWKGLNYEILHYEMEIKIEINDLALTRLDYYLEKLEGDFYSVSEAAAYLTSRFEPVLNKLAAYEELYRDTTKMWDSTTQLYGDIMEGVDETIHQSNEERLEAMSGGLVGAFTGNGVIENNPTDFYTQTADGKPIAVGEEGYINALDRDITQADYVEGLYESFEGIFEELGELVDMDKQMMEFYANAIEMAREELEFYTDSLGHLTNALKHYHKVADITGKTNDYGFMGKMLEAQAAAIENELSVASSNYEMWKQQKAYWEAQLATAEEGTKQWEFYKENLDAAVKATEEAQEEMLQKTEEWAEALRAILEHELQDAARILENALTGGTSFDTMNKALERAESLQEEYLTTTNKIYETTKLMRQAQQEIDKTTNNSSKLRLNMFITETEQLQQQNRLSEYELSIQQAKYQLLLAELALEEAKNSKSTVRLQRDFEGNFGYVYTADQDQIDDALQNLDDKRNELYNIGLEGANNYTSKYLSTLSAMYDEFTTIQQNYLNGMYESEEEYQNALLDAYDYYYEQLKNYEELYGIAIRADSRVTADAWSTDFQDMIYSTEIWADECDVYITQVTELFEEWGETSEDLNQILDDTTGTIDEIVRASDELAASINDHVVPGLQQELDLLNEILRAYGLIRDKIHEDINHYEDTADEIYDDIVEEAERNDYEDEEFEQESPEPAKKTNKPTSSSSSGEKRNPETGGGGGWSEEKTVTETIKVPVQVRNEYEDENGNIITDGWKTEYKEEKRTTTKTYTYDENGKLAGVFDTGGYTGAWGPEGKLAVLHEKEMVLNKSDTENILQAVDMVRQISTGIDQQASYQRIATLITQTLQEKKDNDVLEQHVTIEARFDNVRDRYEIEAAFDNLINKASQYANRNKI